MGACTLRVMYMYMRTRLGGEKRRVDTTTNHGVKHHAVLVVNEYDVIVD